MTGSRVTTQHASGALPMLTRYRAWAVDLTPQAAAHLPGAELVKRRQTTFGSILGTLGHIHIVDEIFRAHLEGREHGYTTRYSLDVELQNLRRNMTQMSHWLVETANHLTPDDCARLITYRSVDGEPNEMTIEEILLHLINHATYRIGYVSDMMYHVPKVPPTTDLTVFLRDVWRAD